MKELHLLHFMSWDEAEDDRIAKERKENQT